MRNVSEASRVKLMFQDTPHGRNPMVSCVHAWHGTVQARAGVASFERDGATGGCELQRGISHQKGTDAMPDDSPDEVERASIESFPASDSPAWTIDRGSSTGNAPRSASKRIDSVLREGVFAGFLGYATLAFFFAVYSLINGHSPFHVAGVLASALFRMASDQAVAVGPGHVLAYHAFHLVVVIVAGIVLAALARLAARALQGWYLALHVLIFGVGHILVLPIWFDHNVRAALPIWFVVIGTLLAAAVMGAYLWIANPDIRTAMHEPDE
jgi:hypothetical protein